MGAIGRGRGSAKAGRRLHIHAGEGCWGLCVRGRGAGYSGDVQAGRTKHASMPGAK